MPCSRLSKIAAVLALAACAFLATVRNITDHSSNFEFVKHGLSMDTSFEGNAAMYRTITNPALWAAGCWSIIAGEAVTGLMPLIGGWRMIRHHRATAEDFNRAKGLAIAGAIVGFLVWFVGFIAVGGEWFPMWQFSVRNGQEAAFRFYRTILAVLIHVTRPETD